MAGPAQPVGLFGKVPCPHCGMPTSTHASGAYAARFAGGLFMWLIVTAVTTKYYCATHGEIPKNNFPPAHQSAISNKMFAKLGGAAFVLILVFGLCAVSALLH